jgi:D-lactate dehydrogenase (cytochrome)
MEVYRATLKQAGLEYVIFGHIGDNHLHINILPQSESDMDKAKEVVMSLAQKVVALKGVVAAEHGIGKLKHDLLRIQYGEKGLEEMARVKKALDPNTILGVGNIFPEAFLRRDL